MVCVPVEGTLPQQARRPQHALVSAVPEGLGSLQQSEPQPRAMVFAQQVITAPLALVQQLQ